MSANILTRVQQLIKLATNAGASENEARNAALSAVKLIAEHKLLEGSSNGNASGFAAFMSNLPIDGIMRNLNVVALGASAMEIAAMKDTNARLTHQIETLRKELAIARRANIEAPPEPSRHRRRR
jgi:hypothetical protein